MQYLLNIFVCGIQVLGIFNSIFLRKNSWGFIIVVNRYIFVSEYSLIQKEFN